MRGVETLTLVLIATVLFMWVVLGHSTPEERARLQDYDGSKHGHRGDDYTEPDRSGDSERQRVARAVLPVDVAIVGAVLTLVALVSPWSLSP
jgi:hypothetical protein